MDPVARLLSEMVLHLVAVPLAEQLQHAVDPLELGQAMRFILIQLQREFGLLPNDMEVVLHQ